MRKLVIIPILLLAIGTGVPQKLGWELLGTGIQLPDSYVLYESPSLTNALPSWTPVDYFPGYQFSGVAPTNAYACYNYRDEVSGRWFVVSWDTNALAYLTNQIIPVLTRDVAPPAGDAFYFIVAVSGGRTSSAPSNIYSLAAPPGFKGLWPLRN